MFYYSMHVSRTQTVVWWSDLISIDLSAGRCSSNIFKLVKVRYTAVSRQSAQSEVFLKFKGHCQGLDLISAQSILRYLLEKSSFKHLISHITHRVVRSVQTENKHLYFRYNLFKFVHKINPQVHS